MTSPSFFARTITAAILLAIAGCQTTIPAPESRRARHEQWMDYTQEALREREAQSPNNLRATSRKFDELIAGNPDSARNTARRLLEQD